MLKIPDYLEMRTFNSISTLSYKVFLSISYNVERDAFYNSSSNSKVVVVIEYVKLMDQTLL